MTNIALLASFCYTRWTEALTSDWWIRMVWTVNQVVQTYNLLAAHLTLCPINSRCFTRMVLSADAALRSWAATSTRDWSWAQACPSPSGDHVHCEAGEPCLPWALPWAASDLLTFVSPVLPRQWGVLKIMWTQNNCLMNMACERWQSSPWSINILAKVCIPPWAPDFYNGAAPVCLGQESFIPDG